MEIQQNISLKNYSTMRLGGNARYLAKVNSKTDLTDCLNWAQANNQKFIIIGNGSNIVWQDSGFDGLVIVSQIKLSEVKEISKTQSLFTQGAGENWDDFVSKTVELGFSGIEQLSLIPGTAGAAPVQNIGAYGRELKDVLESVEVFDIKKNEFLNLSNADCRFGYRTSIFKTHSKGQYAITSITLKLTRTNPQPPFYNSLQTYLQNNQITNYTPASIRQAVIEIRRDKLPDPKQVANNGSFFTNPIVSKEIVHSLLELYTDMPNWPQADEQIKLSAGWLLEHAGFTKGYQDVSTGMALWKNQPLVVVNQSARETSDLLAFKQKIVDTVYSKFGITLEQEPELI